LARARDSFRADDDPDADRAPLSRASRVLDRATRPPPSPPPARSTGASVRSAAFVRASVRPAVGRRADRLVVRAEGDGPDVPDVLKDLLKPPDASVAAPGWLAPVIGLAEEAGEDAPVVGYGIMGATGVFFGLFFAVVGLGGFGFLLTMAGTGYACWQASPYLSAIGDKFSAAPEPTQEPEEPEE
jgi:hypothetical protein